MILVKIFVWHIWVKISHFWCKIHENYIFAHFDAVILDLYHINWSLSIVLLQNINELVSKHFHTIKVNFLLFLGKLCVFYFFPSRRILGFKPHLTGWNLMEFPDMTQNKKCMIIC